MSTFEEHCQESIKLFGRPYEEVHKWLDEFMERKSMECVIESYGIMKKG